MNVARRRSGAFRPSSMKSPKTVRRTANTGLKAQTSRLAAPLPSTMITGRVTAPVRTSTAASSLGISTTNRASFTPSTARTTRSIATTGSSFGNRTVAAPSRRATSSAIPPRPPSELSIVKKENAELKKKYEEMTQQVEQLKKMSEMYCEMMDATKEQLKMTTQQRDMLKMKVETVEIQAETSQKKIEEMTSLNTNLTEQLEEKEVTLRKLHNDVVDLRGQIRVVIRVRPLLESEESSESVEFPAVNTISVNQGSKTSAAFEFEKVLPPIVKQKEVFVQIEDFILSALHGYNVGLIAFGQTGSGKTHTMRGGDGDEEGVIPRAASFLFREAKKLEATGWKFEFVLSFLEIYNNEAYDLLNDNAIVKLRICNQKVTLEGLSEHNLKKLADVDGLLRRADRNRKTAATKCNAQSSRSHAIYIWTIKAHQPSTNISTSSVLKLVDLAGSERAKESGATGSVFKEMTNINQSLSTLQKCVSMQKSKAAHVPYRDAKLTQVLMDCLGGGNSKTMVIVNINPCKEQAMESKRSIEFASKMRETNIGCAVQQRDI